MVGESFCTNFLELDLTKEFEILRNVDKIENSLGNEMSKKIRMGNIKARMRMIYLYNLASAHNGIVLSTDNYTEYLLGFFTIFGDQGDYGMIQNLWKTEVYEMSEWIFKNDIVRNRLKNIFNLNNNKKIYARKCIIKEIDVNTKDKFLEKYHIQGKDISEIRLGAFYNNELISVMTFSKGNISKGSKNEKYIWELNRFCSDYNYHIIGIASKLLSYFKKNYNWKEIFSYADRRWSNGNLYYKIGFELEYITGINYWYIKNNYRIHRFNLRKRKNEPKNITEFELRDKEGYKRIWDCGNYKFFITK